MEINYIVIEKKEEEEGTMNALNKQYIFTLHYDMYYCLDITLIISENWKM